MRDGTGAYPLSDSFGRLITQESLARLAGGKSFARRAGYFDAGAVSDLVQTRGAIKATVVGNDYRVVLRPAGRLLEWSCTCSTGEEELHAEDRGAEMILPSRRCFLQNLICSM